MLYRLVLVPRPLGPGSIESHQNESSRSTVNEKNMVNDANEASINQSSAILGDSVFMGLIAILRNISATLLVIVVIIGTVLYDPRFTALLLPPFFMWYSFEVPSFVMELPIVRLLAHIYTTQQRVFGKTVVNIMVAFAGFALGLYTVGATDMLLPSSASAEG